jgi:hypothetical protein
VHPSQDITTLSGAPFVVAVTIPQPLVEVQLRWGSAGWNQVDT